LDAVMTGQVVRQFIVHNGSLRWPVPPDMPEQVNGQRLVACKRRAKYLLLQFNHGTQIVHLGMSGSLRRAPLDEPRRAHDHIEWLLDDARYLLHDPRRFGAVLWHCAAQGPVDTTHPLLSA